MNLGTTSLRDIAKLRDFRRRRISSFDRTGGNRDMYVFKPFETRVIAEAECAGCITHIWVTMMCMFQKNFPRNVLIRMWWDKEEHPSVECPIGDFFGCGHGKRVNFVSLPLQMSPQRGKGFNCWWPMPFSDGFRIEIENDNPKKLFFYFYVDYEEYDTLDEEDAPYGRFHATFNRGVYKSRWRDRDTGKRFSIMGWQITQGKNTLENEGFEENHLILEAIGRGHYVGCNLNITNPLGPFIPNWPGEGDDMIFIDGEEYPSLHGTGTEDYVNTAYCPSQKYSAPYHGVIKPGLPNFLGQITYYRYHIEDPIPFKEKIKVSIEHGHDNHRKGIWDTTAYWYQIEPHKPFAPLPSRKERQPKGWNWITFIVAILGLVGLGYFIWYFFAVFL